MSRLTRDETAELISRDQILRLEREQGNIHFPCSADPYYFIAICVALHVGWFLEPEKR